MGRMQDRAMTAIRSIAAAMCAAALLLGGTSAIAQRVVQTAENARDYVSEVLPYPLEHVYDRIASLFDSGKRDYYEDYNAAIYDLPEKVRSYKDLSPGAYARFMELPMVRANKFYVFFGAYINVQDVLAHITPIVATGKNNPALERYAALPASTRSEDFYLWSPDVPFWHSEYSLNDEKLPFRSYFVAHLEALDASHTQLEIIEYQPVVRIKNAFTVDIHGKTQPYALKEVPPSTSDREYLLSCIRQFIERNVPGRHYFRCRDKGEKIEEPLKFTNP